MKPSRFSRLALLVHFVFAISVAALAQDNGISLDTAAKRLILDRLTATLKDNAFVPGADFSKLDSLLDEERSALDSAKNEREFTIAVNEALAKLGYSHVQLISPKAVEARQKRQSVGVGIQIQKEDDGLRIINVFPDTPASEVGLVAGDLIVEHAGKKADDPTALAGEEGSLLTIKVQRTTGEVKEYSITRRKYSNIRPESLTWRDSDLAVIKVPSFDLTYDRDRVASLFEQAAGAKRLVLDLRSNPGGSVINLMHLMSFLLPPETPMGTFLSKRTVEQYAAATGDTTLDLAKIGAWSKFKLKVPKTENKAFTGKIAVLINGNSGSASEIAAAALEESGSPVIGSKSAGGVLVSVLAKLPEGFMLQYPVTDYVTQKGVRLEGHGVIPTYDTPPIKKYGDPDSALERAVALLTGKA